MCFRTSATERHSHSHHGRPPVTVFLEAGGCKPGEARGSILGSKHVAPLGEARGSILGSKHVAPVGLKHVAPFWGPLKSSGQTKGAWHHLHSRNMNPG